MIFTISAVKFTVITVRYRLKQEHVYHKENITEH